jgi:hypothetical protein
MQSNGIIANPMDPKTEYPFNTSYREKECRVLNKMSTDSTILTFAIAVYLGGVLKDFVGAITRDLFTPLFAPLFPDAQKSASKFSVQLGPFTFFVGDAVAATLHLFGAMFVVAVALPYIRAYAPHITRK